MKTLDTLAGVLRVRPGQPRPHNLASHRPDWAETLVRGKPASVVPGLLSSLYNLCGHAHRLCAEMALRAAAGRTESRLPGMERALQCETVIEHVRRIGLDWPAQLSERVDRDAFAADATETLRACPALQRAGNRVLDTRLWLERHLLGMPASAWLAGWEREPGWWAAWCESHHEWLPRLMRQCRASAAWHVEPAQPLHVHAGASSLRQLAGRLREDAGYTRQPRWQGDCAETGSWTRLHDSDRPMPLNPWLRLGARVAELARLSLPDVQARSGSGWLASGALHIAPNEGLSWAETARGLLVHHVRLEHASPEPRVASYRVLAPTEWNFHAEGAVAGALEAMQGLDPEESQQRVAALMAAYDPCVRFEVEPRSVAESVHA